MFYTSSLVFVTILELLAAEPKVTVINGEINGMEMSFEGRGIEVYKAIPYAKPPIGPLRFKKPEPSMNWTDPLNGTVYGPSCTQFLPVPTDSLENPEISEDCLTLNVFVPTNSTESTPLAIMVWIYGGGFVAGEAQTYDPRYMAVEGEVIVVTLNYRLGPFGFLSTEDESAPGNFGLWDQLLAIQWIKDNAAAFGGDPERITIFGESAGSWSVSILARSLESQGVFQRAISQSGAIADIHLYEIPIEKARALAELANCNKDDTAELIECLRAVSEQDMVTLNGVTRWFPSVDGVILPDLPSKIDDFGDINYIVGFNELEGFALTLFMPGLIDTSALTNQGTSQETFETSINDFVFNDLSTLADNTCQLQKVVDAFIYAYNYWEDMENDQERLLSLVKFLGDARFAIPSVQLAQFHRDANGSGATYLYHFTYKPDINNPAFTINSLFDPVWNDKATHGDELKLMFYPDTMFPPDFNEFDRNVSETIIHYWTNFARTGNPNMPNNEGMPEWKQFGVDGEYVEIGEVPLIDRDMNDLDPEHLNFWLDLIPKLFENSCSPTTTTTTTATSVPMTTEPCTESPEESDSEEEDEEEEEESEKNTFDLTVKQSEVVIWVMIALVIIMFLLNLVMCLSYIHRKNLNSYIQN